MIKNTHLTINIKDMDVSIALYESLGFTLDNRWGNHYAQLSATGIPLGLHPTVAETIKGSGSVFLGFTADDFGAAQQLLTKNGNPYHERSEKGGKFLHFIDPDGTSLYFIQPKK
jgi:catechol 2,3-dioxygenase-like lactoylglutathione lyase family enzyme